ncbi:alpha-glucuronidase family glycosyl hydrolase [Bacteroidota bacterium]
MKRRLALLLTLYGFLMISNTLNAENGYDLWLRYAPPDSVTGKWVESVLSEVMITDHSPVSEVIRQELSLASTGMLSKQTLYTDSLSIETGLIIGLRTDPVIDAYFHASALYTLSESGKEAFCIQQVLIKNNKRILITANTSTGLLYGTFYLLKELQKGERIDDQPSLHVPKIKQRLLNHWDNLDRTVERGYAGFSIWDWHRLPDYIDQRYIDYARANASIGINGTVLTNVNANALVLTPGYLQKVRALADVFRPYGIRVYLTARFSAPMEIGGLKTADPLDKDVADWWKEKAKEIYALIPDFGGFLVKANSEGQPGPQNYDRSHAEGANMLADAVKPYGGIVMWRAFVYSSESPEDRAKQANLEFEPLDGQFRENVVIQVKNGPIDFQPREPFHPLFGAMKETALAMEFQVTQEYLGQGTSLAFLAPMYKEVIDAGTYKPEKETTVAQNIDGTAFGHDLSVIAGVSNIGNDINWTGHPLSQANWYAYGRLAWDHDLSSEQIADEWIRLTYGNNKELVDGLKDMLLRSHEIVVNYMTPLGLHHIMGRGHHYGPGPWVTGGRADWTSPYYHRADSLGIGFDRTVNGSNALAQYAPEIVKVFSDPITCPDKYLLWFHHLPWNFSMKSGNMLWDEICYSYDKGVQEMGELRIAWDSLGAYVDPERHRQIRQLLSIQVKEAKWWRNACLLYFQQFSQLPFPEDIEQPEGELEEYMNMQFPYAPGIRPSW